MEKELITISEYCIKYEVDPAFIGALEESGLISLTLVEGTKCILYEQLVEMERYIHFHYDLKINMEGIDVIINLLQKIKDLQHEIETLKIQAQLHHPPI